MKKLLILGLLMLSAQAVASDEPNIIWMNDELKGCIHEQIEALGTVENITKVGQKYVMDACAPVIKRLIDTCMLLGNEPIQGCLFIAAGLFLQDYEDEVTKP